MRNALLVALTLVGCTDQSPAPEASARSLFNSYVYPILAQKCSTGSSGCHSQSADDLPSPLGFIGAPDTAYDLVTAPSYAGAFGNDAPLLTHHTGSTQQLSGDARQLVEEWLGRERLERGL
jgi:hypothetical protein